MAKRTTNDFAEVISARLAKNPKLAQAVEKEAFNADIAQKVYDLRTEAGLTQKQLAIKIGTSQSVISRIEDSDYDGHSLALLNRIADALSKKLRVEFYACSQNQAIDMTDFEPHWKTVSTSWKPVFHEVSEYALPA